MRGILRAHGKTVGDMALRAKLDGASQHLTAIPALDCGNQSRKKNAPIQAACSDSSLDVQSKLEEEYPEMLRQGALTAFSFSVSGMNPSNPDYEFCIREK